jgi:hypothetical protein
MPIERLRARPVRWIVAALTVALPVTLSLRRSLSMDEYVYLHWAYEASRGVVAGVDYFSPQLPFMQFILAPLFWPVWAWPELGAMVERAVFALMATASVTLAFLLYERAKGARLFQLGLPVVGVAAACVTGFETFSERMVEVRPDNVYIFFSLASLACFPVRSDKKRATISGALFACGLLCSYKMLVLAAGLAAAMVVILVFSRAARTRAFGSDGRGFVLGFVGFAAVGALVSTKLHFVRFAEEMRALMAWAKLHETRDKTTGSLLDTFAPWARSRPGGEGYLTLLQICVVSFGVVVVVAVVRALVREPNRPKLPWSLVYLALVVGAALTYAIQWVPFEYSRNVLFVFAVPLGVDAVMSLCVADPRAVRIGLEWALWLFLVNRGVDLIKHEQPGADAQREAFREVRKATIPTDCVFDCTSIAFFRQHAHPNWVTIDGLQRTVQVKELAEQLPPAILDHGCVAAMVDSRNQGLADSVHAFLDSHFLAVSSHLYLYSTPLQGSTSADFYAPQASWYALAGAPAGAGVKLNPDDAWTDRLWLEQGHHQLLVSRPGLRLLFQPRDGTKKDPYRGPMDMETLSHI